MKNLILKAIEEILLEKTDKKILKREIPENE